MQKIEPWLHQGNKWWKHNLLGQVDASFTPIQVKPHHTTGLLDLRWFDDHLKKKKKKKRKKPLTSFPGFAVFKDKFFNLVSVSLSVKWRKLYLIRWLNTVKSISNHIRANTQNSYPLPWPENFTFPLSVDILSLCSINSDFYLSRVGSRIGWSGISRIAGKTWWPALNGNSLWNEENYFFLEV